MIWPRYKATNIRVSHILRKNGGDTPEITAHFNQRPGQGTLVGAAVAPLRGGWGRAGRMPGAAGGSSPARHRESLLQPKERCGPGWDLRG